MTSIRPATAADMAAVADLWHEGWHVGHAGHVPDGLTAARTLDAFRARTPTRVADTTVALGDSGDLLGFVMVVVDEVEQVFVGPDTRGTGVASLLLEEAERQVAAGGHAEAWLAVVAGNARARAFYEKRGWHDEGDLPYEVAAGGQTFVSPCRRYAKHLETSTAVSRVYVDMVGDLFHAGHVALLREARRHGDWVVVGVLSDDTVASYKRRPIMTLAERVTVIESCRYVDEVVPDAPFRVTEDFLAAHGITAVIHGDDLSPEGAESIYGPAVATGAFVSVPRTGSISTTQLIQRVLDAATPGVGDDASALVSMDQDVTVRSATSAEVAPLPSIQVAAGERFREIHMARVADGPPPDVEQLAQAQRAGHLLVAIVEAQVVGFVHLEVLDAALHVEQVSVAPGFGGRGTGRRLMLAAEDLARQSGHDRLTLTAFRDVPFNGPFYESLGWQVLAADTLSPGLGAARQMEADAGLDIWPRQAMERHV